MKILLDSSVLISASIIYDYSEQNKKYRLKHKFFNKCDALIQFLKANPQLEIGIVTKTVETEAGSAIRDAVLSTLNQIWWRVPNFVKAKQKMILHYIMVNESLDRLDHIVEECSIRLPIDTKKRDEIKTKEIIPFLNKLVPKTSRYRQPHLPPYIRGADFRKELSDILLASSPALQIIYKGMPGDKDLTIMAEATFIYRKYADKEKVYVASMDNNFKPNPVPIGSYLAGYKNQYDGTLDSTVRDALAETFGFIGEEPPILMAQLKSDYPTATFP